MNRLSGGLIFVGNRYEAVGRSEANSFRSNGGLSVSPEPTNLRRDWKHFSYHSNRFKRHKIELGK
jgi:hypothetical protein